MLESDWLSPAKIKTLISQFTRYARQVSWKYAFESPWSLCVFSNTKVQFTHFSISNFCVRYANLIGNS